MQSAEIYKREIDLVRFAIETYGFQVNKKKSSKRQIVLHSAQDKIIISRNPEGQYWYFNPANSKDKGTIIDFVLHRNQNNQEETWEVLEQYIKQTEKYPDSIEIPAQPQTHTFSYSPLSDSYYLEKRSISIRTIFSPEFNQRIFNHIHTIGAKQFVNTAFPLYLNKKIVGLELKNTHYHGYAPGSMKSLGLWVSNFEHLKPDHSVKWVITESGVDCLSFHQLFPPDNTEKRVYISTGGVITKGQLDEIQHLVSKFSDSSIILANDKDLAGAKQNIQILGQIELNQKSKRFKCWTSQDENNTSLLYIEITKGEHDLIFESNTMAKLFSKDQQLEVSEENITIQRNDNIAILEIPLSTKMIALERLETIIPAIRGIKKLIKVQKPKNKDFNEDVIQSFQKNPNT